MSLLSVGIPVWRIPRQFLEDAIDSVLNQENFPERIPIVVVAARNDPQIGWLPKAYADVEIRWVKKNHVGVQHDEAVRGDLESVWTAFLDSDDAWEPHTAAAVLKATNEVALFGDLILCHADLSRQKLRRVPSKITVANTWNGGRGNLFSDHAIFRRSAMRKIGWYKIGKFPQKFYCWHAWICLATQYGPGRFKKVPAYYRYRQWKGQLHRYDEQRQPLKRQIGIERRRFVSYWKRRL